MKNSIFIHLFFVALTLTNCINPFAPHLEEGDGTPSLLGDQRTIEGLFKNFEYAYNFRDTLIYANLLHPDFLFVYRDYDRGVDVSWGKTDEMRATSGLFRNTQDLDLTWNEIVYEKGDSVSYEVIRSFTLVITFNASDVISIDGRANFRLTRPSPDSLWRILYWRDESNF